MSNEDKCQFKKCYVTAKTTNGIKGSLDTFTLFIELGYNLLCKNGTMGYIVPIALTSSDSLAGIHHLLLNNCEDIYISSYAVRPLPVFKNAVVNTSIILYRKTLSPCEHLYSTKMYRKGKNFNLQYLIDNLEFLDVRDLVLYGRIPKVSLPIERRVLIKLLRQKRLGEYLKDYGKPIVYRFAGGRYFKVVTNYSNNSSAERTVYFEDKFANPIGCILSSNLSFWFYQIYSDNLNWKNYEFSEFRIPDMNDRTLEQLELLYLEYLSDIEHNANIRQTNDDSSYNVSSFKEYKIGKSKFIIDKIDDLICPLYGLTQEETEFIKNYEIKFRLSDEE